MISQPYIQLGAGVAGGLSAATLDITVPSLNGLRAEGKRILLYKAVEKLSFDTASYTDVVSAFMSILRLDMPELAGIIADRGKVIWDEQAIPGHVMTEMNAGMQGIYAKGYYPEWMCTPHDWVGDIIDAKINNFSPLFTVRDMPNPVPNAWFGAVEDPELGGQKFQSKYLQHVSNIARPTAAGGFMTRELTQGTRGATVSAYIGAILICMGKSVEKAKFTSWFGKKLDAAKSNSGISDAEAALFRNPSARGSYRISYESFMHLHKFFAINHNVRVAVSSALISTSVSLTVSAQATAYTMCLHWLVGTGYAMIDPTRRFLLAYPQAFKWPRLSTAISAYLDGILLLASLPDRFKPYYKLLIAGRQAIFRNADVGPLFDLALYEMRLVDPTLKDYGRTVDDTAFPVSDWLAMKVDDFAALKN